MKVSKYVVVILALTFVSRSTIAQYADRKVAAILIGNHAYHSPNLPPLNFPNNDVEKLGKLCKELRMDTCVITFEKKTQKEFFDDLRIYKKQILEPRHITDLVIYYSGHGGSHEGGESFLIPTEYQPLEIVSLYNLYTAKVGVLPSRDLHIYLEKLQAKSDSESTPYELEFRNRLNYFNLIENAAPIAMLCDSLKEFNLLFISDACRTPFTNSARGLTNLAGLPIDDKGYVKQWLKNNLHDYSGRADTFVSDFRKFNNYVNKTIGDFDKKCAYFNNTLSDPGIRKPVTLLYGTNFYNTSVELASIFSGVFTQCFLQNVRGSKSSPILIDDNFINNITRCINSTQKPMLAGVRSFDFPNTFIRSQPVNSATITRAISNKSFKAVKITLSKPPEKHIDLLTRNTDITRKIDQKELKTYSDFSHFFIVDTSLNRVPNFNVETKVRLPELSLAFEDSKISFSLFEENTIFGGNDYSFNKEKQSFSLTNGSVSNINNLTKKTENYLIDGDYNIIDDSTVSLKKSLLIPNILNCDIVTIKKISAGFDTVDMEIPDSYSTNVLKIQMVVSNSGKKTYKGADIPYTGALSNYKTKIINRANYSKGDSYFPTNEIFDNKWKNGKYKCVLRLKANIDSLQLTSDTALTHKLRADFLRLQVNNVSNCDDSQYPNNKAIACFKELSEVKYGIEIFQQTLGYVPLTIHFEIIDADPSQLKLSIPFYYTGVKNYIKNVDVESVTLECVEEYSEARVKDLLHGGTDVQVVH